MPSHTIQSSLIKLIFTFHSSYTTPNPAYIARCSRSIPSLTLVVLTLNLSRSLAESPLRSACCCATTSGASPSLPFAGAATLVFLRRSRRYRLNAAMRSSLVPCATPRSPATVPLRLLLLPSPSRDSGGGIFRDPSPGGRFAALSSA